MANLIVPGASDLAIGMREPALLVPGRKPVGPVEIDWTLPVTRGLVMAWVGGRTNLVNGAPPITATVGTEIKGQDGICASLGTTSAETARLSFPLARQVALWSGATVMVKVLDLIGTNNTLLVSGISNADNSYTYTLGVEHNYVSNDVLRGRGYGTWAGRITPFVSSGNEPAFVWTDTSGIVRASIAGTDLVSTNETPAHANNNFANVANVVDDLERASGAVAYLFVWDRVLSSVERSLLRRLEYAALLKPAT